VASIPHQGQLFESKPNDPQQATPPRRPGLLKEMEPAPKDPIKI
jgi:hypothetical protein